MNAALSRALALLVLLGASCAARAALPPTLSGSWFDPAHAGHGLSIELLDGDRALAYWFTYDPEGRPLHLLLDAAVRERTLRGPAYVSRGLPFPGFDRAGYSLEAWGTIEITFSSCTAARLRFDASGPAGGPAYGRGDIALVRLASIGDLACAGNTFPHVEPAVLLGEAAGIAYRALVDANGATWIAATPTPLIAASNTALSMVSGTARHDDGAIAAGAIVAEATARPGHAPEPLPEPGAPRARLVRLRHDEGAVFIDLLDGGMPLGLARDDDASVGVARAWDSASLFGRRYDVRYETRVGPEVWTLDLSDDTFCLSTLRGACEWFGTIRVSERDRSVFEFELRGPASPGRGAADGDVADRGTGWIEWRDDEPVRMVLVGENGLVAVGLLRD